MLNITGIGIIDFLLTILFVIIIAVVVVKVCQALGLTADALMIPTLVG